MHITLLTSTALLYNAILFLPLKGTFSFYIITLYSCMRSVLQRRERCYQKCGYWCKTYWYGCIQHKITLHIMMITVSRATEPSNITRYNMLYKWKLSREILHVGHVYVNRLCKRWAMSRFSSISPTDSIKSQLSMHEGKDNLAYSSALFVV